MRISAWTTTATTLPGRWTKRARCSSAEELEFAAKYWDIGELGDMHHNPAKNVLHVNHTLDELATQSGASRRAMRALRDSARAKLLAARALRPTPFIDRTLYTGWNAMAVTAYLEAARVLRWTARGSLRCARSTGCSTRPGMARESLRHVIAYPGRRWRRGRARPARSTIMPSPCTPASTHGSRAAR